ncbi:MAG: SET domain-containing protein-lysine N-methyltransferase, partial [Mesorhizobium sp.]
MLLVDVYLDKSRIQGIGVFAKNHIPRGTLVW